MNFFGTALKKIMNMLHESISMKEIIDSLLHIALLNENYGHTESKNLNYHCTKFSQKRSFFLLYSHIEGTLYDVRNL